VKVDELNNMSIFAQCDISAPKPIRLQEVAK
jgi:hypothetical protein